MADPLAFKLDDYSRFAIALILKRFPAWESYVSVRPYATAADDYYVVVDIPCPSPGVERGLYVSTKNNELTVGFHTDHSHFTDFATPLNPAVIHAGLDHAVEFLRDRSAVLSWYRGNRLVHTTMLKLPHAGHLPCLISACTKGTLRCWSGKFDRDESEQVIT